MDHCGMEIDRVDLERYRYGLAPVVRKWYKATPVTIKQITEDALNILTKQFKKKAK